MMKFGKFSGKRICVATSGGQDSTCLLHYLKSLETEYGFSLSAVHCEHGIRGEASLQDAEFVKELCFQWGIPLYTFSADCVALAKSGKQSLETTARNFRYACFLELVQGGKVDYVATAHHQDDEAETVLFRLARGTSLSGAKAMQEENGWLLRPILEWSKADVEGYVKANGLEYRNDSTNFQMDATRNKLRLCVLPSLEDAVAGAKGNLARFARLAQEDDAYLYALANALVSDHDGGYTVAFSTEKPLFRRACLTAMKALGVEKDYTTAHLDSLFSLQNAQTGAKLDLPNAVQAEKTAKGIAFYQKSETVCRERAQSVSFSKDGFDGGVYFVRVSEKPLKESGEFATLRIDGGKLPKDAVFRFREVGDEIEKFGGGTKSLKKFFNEYKIPVSERAYLPLIAEKDGREVYVACGVEISEKVKVEKDTENVLYISLQRKE
ncbi:MAG: tRNA lysidine(34) synthetase TilS [Clostridia bacterium]|nr:tRNA lysidine(34) synthetase TilS [Clostridia bacterium]